MRVAMIGSGYMGLVSRACLADFGHQVTCVDKDESKIDALDDGQVPIYGPGLTELVGNKVEGRTAADMAATVKQAEAVFIVVCPTSARGVDAAVQKISCNARGRVGSWRGGSIGVVESIFGTYAE